MKNNWFVMCIIGKYYQNQKIENEYNKPCPIFQNVVQQVTILYFLEAIYRLQSVLKIKECVLKPKKVQF